MNTARPSFMKLAVAISGIWLALTCTVALAADADDFNQDEKTSLGGLGSQVYGDAATAQAHSDPLVIVGQVVSMFIGLVGVVFLVLIVYAGYLWLTARGDEKQVTKAKETLQRSIIGMIIVISAYAISTFLFTRLTGTPAEESAAPVEEVREPGSPGSEENPFCVDNSGCEDGQTCVPTDPTDPDSSGTCS